MGIAFARYSLYRQRMILYRSFSDIIRAWPNAEEFGRDIGVIGVTARQMRNRNSLAPEHWEKTVSAAAARKIAGVTLELLARISASGGAIAEDEAAEEPAEAPLKRTGTDGPL